MNGVSPLSIDKLVDHTHMQFRTQSPQALWSAVSPGVLEFYWISVVKQWKPLRNLYRAANQKIQFFFKFSRSVSSVAYLLTKKPKDSGYEIDSHAGAHLSMSFSIPLTKNLEIL